MRAPPRPPRVSLTLIHVRSHTRTCISITYLLLIDMISSTSLSFVPLHFHYIIHSRYLLSCICAHPVLLTAFTLTLMSVLLLWILCICMIWHGMVGWNCVTLNINCVNRLHRALPLKWLVSLFARSHVSAALCPAPRHMNASLNDRSNTIHQTLSFFLTIITIRFNFYLFAIFWLMIIIDNWLCEITSAALGLFSFYSVDLCILSHTWVFSNHFEWLIFVHP